MLFVKARFVWYTLCATEGGNKISNEVFNREEVSLFDGTTISLRPLAIKPLKNFIKEAEKLDDLKDQMEVLDALFSLAKVCLVGIGSELGKREDLDELLDMETVYKIIEVCGGVKLNDPNLIAAANQAMLAEGSRT